MFVKFCYLNWVIEDGHSFVVQTLFLSDHQIFLQPGAISGTDGRMVGLARAEEG